METALVVPARVRWSGSLIERSMANDGSHLEADDSAFHALTDFQREYPITVDTDTSIDEALADMNRLCVHALLATQGGFECEAPQVAGLITATALDLYQMFQGTGLTHLLIIETQGADSAVARGLLSRATLAKRLQRSPQVA
jgi:hypothetical protein